MSRKRSETSVKADEGLPYPRQPPACIDHRWRAGRTSRDGVSGTSGPLWHPLAAHWRRRILTVPAARLQTFGAGLISGQGFMARVVAAAWPPPMCMVIRHDTNTCPWRNSGAELRARLLSSSQTTNNCPSINWFGLSTDESSPIVPLARLDGGRALVVLWGPLGAGARAGADAAEVTSR